ncbi:MAG: hypothetical protein ACKVZ0_22405 [Gemmatimonadales bacterium]
MGAGRLVIGLIMVLAGRLAGQAEGGLHYRIDATVAADQPIITARATIRIPRSALARPTEARLGLALSGGRRIQVSATGDSAARTVPFTLGPDSTTLTVPVAAGAGPAVVMIEYQVPFDTAATHDFGYLLATSTSDEEAWYPTVLGISDSLARFRHFETNIEVPRGLAVLATGALVDTVPSETGVLHRYRAADVEGVALAVGPGHRVEAAGNGRTRVRAFAPLADVARFRRIAVAAAEAAEWYRSTYGFFPANEIGIVPGFRSARGGYPLPQMFMIHRGDLSDEFVRWITAHELAHYYWGLHVLDADERLGWLTLGTGIWTDQLYLARTANRSIPAQWRRPDGDNAFEDYAGAMIGGYDQRLGLPDSLVQSLPYDYNSLVRHGKGATAIYLLAEQLGADRFVEIQRALLTSHGHRRLSVADFATALEAAGARGAGALLSAWPRGDARIDFAVRSVRPDPADPRRQWVTVERTGTIAYPVTVEATGPGGTKARARLDGTGELDSVTLAIAGPIELRLDPDGVVPMRASANLEMRRVFLRAMGATGSTANFLILARAHLAADPDPYLAALVIERSFELGRYPEVFAMAQRVPAAVTCLDRRRCMAALQVARSLMRLGKAPGARAWLQNVEPAMARLGVAGGRRLVEAKGEIR